MKTNRLSLICALMAMVLTAQAQKELVILHTNDTHSTVLPLSKNLNDTLKAGRGGYLRIVSMIGKEREKNPGLLLFDSGDFCQGSAFYTLFKGDVEVGLMNEMKYDAATIGNHEFDFGLENMARNFRDAKFPIVCANYDFTGTVVEGLVKPYIIINRDGVKIGVFGISPQLEGLVSAANYEGVNFLDPIATANEVAALLKDKEHCDVVICLSHLGWDIAPNVDDIQLMEQTRNIDLVLGGHSHTYLEEMQFVENLDGKPIGNDQNGKHGIYVGKIVLKLDGE